MRSRYASAKDLFIRIERWLARARARRRFERTGRQFFGPAFVAAIAILVPSLVSGGAAAEPLVVVEARGVASTAGTLIDSGSHLTLRVGEHVRLIGENGNQYCLDGPYDGPAMPTRELARGVGWNLWKTGARDQADPLTDCLQ